MLMVHSTRTRAQRPYRQTGFTLVELLVVIAVIAILAAISIVSYNGISLRATDAKLRYTANSLEKKVKLKQVTDGSASPATTPANLNELIEIYQIESLTNDVRIRTKTATDNCVVNLSTVCDDTDPLYEKLEIVDMVIYTDSVSGNCETNGGVVIYAPNLTNPAEGGYYVEISDDPTRPVGESCFTYSANLL